MPKSRTQLPSATSGLKKPHSPGKAQQTGGGTLACVGAADEMWEDMHVCEHFWAMSTSPFVLGAKVRFQTLKDEDEEAQVRAAAQRPSLHRSKTFATILEEKTRGYVQRNRVKVGLVVLSTVLSLLPILGHQTTSVKLGGTI